MAAKASWCWNYVTHPMYTAWRAQANNCDTVFLQISKNSAVKKTDGVYQCEGCPCWILSPLTVCANYCFCYFHSLFKWKIWKTCVVVKFSNKFQMHWIFIQTRQRNLETFDIISHAFLPLTVAKLSTLKNSPVFGPPGKYRKGDQNTER